MFLQIGHSVIVAGARRAGKFFLTRGMTSCAPLARDGWQLSLFSDAQRKVEPLQQWDAILVNSC
jgi:hypothetical protein